MRNRSRNWFAEVELCDRRVGIIRTLGLKTSLWIFNLGVDLKCHDKVLSEFNTDEGFHL